MARDVVFVTGGGSGIGMGLAEAFHARGARVIIAGRTREKLEAVAARHPGMEIEDLEVSNAADVAACVERVSERHPGLNVVINNAGIRRLIDFGRAEAYRPEEIAEEIDVNLKGLIYVTNAFLPLLKQQSTARLVHIGSGLGFVPLVFAPIYSATKAATHSFTVSLRTQLRGTGVKVIEIIPPAVETALDRTLSVKPPPAMKLDAFVSAAMAGLDAGREEVPVGLAKVLLTGSRIAPGFLLNMLTRKTRALLPERGSRPIPRTHGAT